MITPKVLHTPTDLSEEAVAEITAHINVLAADAVALWLKTKGYHWHVSGFGFYKLHEMFDEQATAIYESIDILAERVRKIGGVTIRGIADVSKYQTTRDELEDFVTPSEMVNRLLDDNRQTAEAIRRTIYICARHLDSGSENVLQNLLDETERRIWFLYETAQGMVG